MKRRLIWLTIPLALTALAVRALWPSAPPQIITLWDGRQYQFAGATWGTNHSQPRLLARVVDSLPTNWAAYARAKLNPRFALDPPVSTPNPSLVVWLKLISSNAVAGTIASNHPIALRYTYLITALADENGFRSGVTSTFSPLATNQWLSGGWFESVPRRSRILEYDLLYLDPNGNASATAIAHFKFANPALSHFPQWQPEPLPAVKSAGDLRVHLNSFTIHPPGHPSYEWTTSLSLSLDLSNGTNDTWAVDDLTLTDATSNHLEAYRPTPGPDGTYIIGGALWPGESAWRLRVALKRTNNIPPGDIITFTNLPILPAASSNWGNTTRLTNPAHGTPIVIENYYRSTWVHEGYSVVLDPTTLEASGLAGDILNVTTDAGDPTPNEGSLNRDFKTLPPGAKTYTVTVAAQKPRYIEFLIKPPPMSFREGESPDEPKNLAPGRAAAAAPP